MLFGDPTDFAIEADVEPGLVPPSVVWGHMCVWCRGFALGRIEERYCCLALSCELIGRLAANLDALWAPELAVFDNVSRWNFLKGLLYGYHGDIALDEHDRRTLEEVQTDTAEYSKFDFLTNWGESFDGGFASFIFRPPGEQVCILSRAFPANMSLCARVSPEGFVSAAMGFVTWYQEQERRLRVNV